MKMGQFILGFIIAFALTSAEDLTRPVFEEVIPGTSKIVLVTEGVLEPRSIGSYSLRVYAGADPRFPYDHFLDGDIRPRNGVVESIEFKDFNGDSQLEIIVIMRSVGTGGYLSADAFQLKDGKLVLLSTVAGLSKVADPLLVLSKKMSRESDHQQKVQD